MKSTIEALSKACLREKVMIMAGGAPVTRQYAEKIGSDGFSDSAASAVALARELVARN